MTENEAIRARRRRAREPDKRVGYEIRIKTALYGECLSPENAQRCQFGFEFPACAAARERPRIFKNCPHHVYPKKDDRRNLA